MIEEGIYDGKVLGRHSFLNKIWKGKQVFHHSDGRVTVVNSILGQWAVEGEVTEIGFENRLLITYPSGLKDVLIPLGRNEWKGTMALGPFSIKFTLKKRT